MTSPTDTASIPATEVRATGVEVTEASVIVHLEDGRTLTTPLAWYPRLVYGTREERQNVHLIGGGTGLHWPDLDEDISVRGMLAGRPSQEGPQSLQLLNRLRVTFPEACFERTDLNVSDRSENSREDVWNTPGLAPVMLYYKIGLRRKALHRRVTRL